MSFRNVQGNDIVNSKTFKAKNNPALVNWVRNPTWATMPSITSSNEEVDMLVAVYPESNFIGMVFNTSAGTYHVDWGDGTTGDFASAAQADHQYTFSTAALANTDGPVTFQDSGDTVTRTAHGYTDGMTISFATIVTTTGIVPLQKYYVISSTANTFRVSATQGGSSLPLTTDGSGTILQFKQAIIKVTCNTGGATLTTVNLQVRNATSLLQAYAQPILDATISANCSALTIGGTTVPPRNLEKCTILRHNSTSAASLFQNCFSLQSVPLFNTSAVTDLSLMFSGCASLQSVPLFNTSAVTNMSTMFANCASLQSVPLFNTSAVTNMFAAFSGCSSLQSVPLFNTASVTNMSTMFANCASLQSVPLFNTASVTNMNSMFGGASTGCSSLQSVPLFNTASVTNMNSMFRGCSSLQSVPLFNTAAVTDMGTSTTTGMFSGCSSLQSVPLFNTASVTNMGGVFNACTSLQSVPLFNTAAVTTFSNIFASCTSLQSIPAFATNATTGTTAFTNFVNGCTALQSIPDINFGRTAITTNASYTNMFNGCFSLSSIGTSAGPKFTFSVTACKLSPAALDALYTSLPSVTTQTITVTNNWGTASDTPSIATAKGWTVTG